jgi:hypothetical protein
MKSGERVVDGSFVCQPTTGADHKAGDCAKTVTVSVSVKCSEEVFDLAGAQRMASGFLQNSPPNTVDLTGYKLVGSVVTTLTSATVVSGQNQVSVNIQAAGRWVFQFSDPLKQQIKQALVKRSKAEAQNILKQYMGISSATIDLSSGSVMPDKVNDIALKIVSIPGLQPGTPTSTPTVPAGTPPDTNTPGTKPNATSTPDLGGS